MYQSEIGRALSTGNRACSTRWHRADQGCIRFGRDEALTREAAFNASYLQRVIYAALELPAKLHGTLVGEGQDLGQDHAGDALLQIDPVIAVEEPGPGQAAGATAIGPGIERDHGGEPPSAAGTGKEIQIVRPLGHRRPPN